MLDYGKYIIAANRYQRKAKAQDREDLNHTIILSLAQAQLRLDNNGGGQLSDIAMLRLASSGVREDTGGGWRGGWLVAIVLL